MGMNIDQEAFQPAGLGMAKLIWLELFVVIVFI
jgi:hypothetical protein